MARKKKDENVDEILEELDELEDEEEVEDDEEDDDDLEEVDEDDDEEEDDDEFEEEPDAKPSKSKRSKAKAKAKKSADDGIGTAEVAEAAGTSTRALRMLLRAEFPREEGGRYRWSSLNHPEVKKILKRVKAGGVKEQQSKKLDKVKKNAKAKKTTKKGSKKKK